MMATINFGMVIYSVYPTELEPTVIEENRQKRVSHF